MSIKTAVIQIGTSDNKLTQNEWAHFVTDMRIAIEAHAFTVQFSGGSDWDAPWQNACWVIEIEDERLPDLKREIVLSRERFQQEAVALTVAETIFI